MEHLVHRLMWYTMSTWMALMVQPDLQDQPDPQDLLVWMATDTIQKPQVLYP